MTTSTVGLTGGKVVAVQATSRGSNVAAAPSERETWPVMTLLRPTGS
ncbi:MAG: hypothetical protein VB080_09585 [Propionicimonas sp.]|nr:hypothetical protein [Propionicimonas sp.]MEA4944671.1 hypothetical protein [Propionicimonas sp.]MEA5117854.1 hypothetical protein [Propionicimonas sp.]